MWRFESLQSEESRAQPADSPKVCSTPRAFHCVQANLYFALCVDFTGK